MKIAMLLIWVLFLATAVEALPGGGGRQLGKGPRAHRQARRAICKTACQNKPKGRAWHACMKKCKNA